MQTKRSSKLRKLLLWTAIILLLLVMFRGPLFRLMVAYDVREERRSYVINDPELIKEITSKLKEEPPRDAEDLIALSLDITADHLSFSSASSSNDPNLLCKKPEAHCVGYSAFFDAVLRYSAQQSGIKLDSQPVAGKIYFLGFDVHECTDDPFFRDHDFNTVKDPSGRIFFIDPSLYDYTGITYLRGR